MTLFKRCLALIVCLTLCLSMPVKCLAPAAAAAGKGSPASIRLNRTSAALVAGGRLKLKAALKPSTAAAKLTWRSSDPKVAKVSQKGVVTALKAGKVTITARTKNGKKASCRITVKGKAYITPTGKKYHLKSCPRIRRSKLTALTLAEAKARGYTACRVCRPGK